MICARRKPINVHCSTFHFRPPLRFYLERGVFAGPAKDELSARKARALQRSALGTFSLLQADHSQVKSHDYDYGE